MPASAGFPLWMIPLWVAVKMLYYVTYPVAVAPFHAACTDDVWGDAPPVESCQGYWCGTPPEHRRGNWPQCVTLAKAEKKAPGSFCSHERLDEAVNNGESWDEPGKVCYEQAMRVGCCLSMETNDWSLMDIPAQDPALGYGWGQR